MDTGALVFLIIFEALVIAWQASKLKQYSKFEHLFNPENAGAATTGSSAVAKPDAQQNMQADAASGQATASAASAAVADKLAVSDDVDEELMDMPGVDPEGNIEEAKRVQLVMARCRYAEFYLEQLDDDYELGQFRRIVNSCISTARNITDPFFRASALHPVIVLLNRAEWTTERDQLLSEVDDELVKQRINDELASSEH